MTKKKTIEIPLNVALTWRDASKEMQFEDDKPMLLAIQRALPQTREERLGLPWTPRDDGFVVTNDGSSVCGLGTQFDALAQAKLIAAAPKMAELLEQVYKAGGINLSREVEIGALLRECNWIE